MKDATQRLPDLLSKALALQASPSFDGDLDYKAPPLPMTSEAAVLVLIDDFDTSQIILTKRQSHMRKHAGQVAFPGGRKDASDVDHWHTALREANEEIGLPLDHPLEKIGQLNTHKTITQFTVTPCVAINRHPFALRAEIGEVEAIFKLPLTHIRPDKFQIQHHDYNGQKRHFFVLDHPEFYIWGATARILQNLGKRLEHVGYF